MVAPSLPALDGKVTVTLAELPAAIVPMVIGNGVPVAEPSVAEVSCTLVADALPLLVTVTVA